MTASALGHKDVCEYLLDKGADVNAQEIDYGTALIGAAKEGHQKIALLLLERGATLDIIHKSDFTALSFGVFNDDLSMCSSLLKNSFFIPKGQVIPKDLDEQVINTIYTYTIKRLTPLCEKALEKRQITSVGMKIKELISPNSLESHFGKAIKETIVRRLFTKQVHLQKCASCSKSYKTLKRCGRCKKVKYCSVACQKDDWKNHKTQCKVEQDIDSL